MKLSFALLCGCLIAFAPVGAETAGGDGAQVSPDAGRSAEVLPPDIVRDPFWPVGYVPPYLIQKPQDEQEVEAEATETQRIDELRQLVLADLKVGGIVRQGRNFFATVNGQMVQAGDVIAVQREGYLFRFAIRSINMRKVQIEPLTP